MTQNPATRPVIAVVGAGPNIRRQWLAASTYTTGIEIYFGPSTARYYIIDLRTESDAISSFSKIKHEFGPVSVLVYNNGARRVNGRSILRRINPLGTFWATKFTLPNRLAETKGTILFTGATGSLRGSAGLSSFSPGKFGLRSLAQIMMPEYQAKGIHVAHLAIDGPVDGKLIRGWTRRKWVMQPNEVAGIYLYLHTQPRSTWTQEIDLRAQKESIFSKL
ncbi:unnamed protein product [Diplocarpon coronariae]